MPLKAWWRKHRWPLMIGLCTALVLLAAVYALAYVQARRQFHAYALPGGP